MLIILRTVRCLDALFYAFIALGFFVFFESQSETVVTSRPSILLSVPVLAITLATLALPICQQWSGTVIKDLFMLKLLALITAGLSPFIAWHAHGSDSLYLVFVAGLALVTAFYYMIVLLRVIEILPGDRVEPAMLYLNRILRSVTGFALLTPAATVYIFVVLDMISNRNVPADILYRFWIELPASLQTAIPLLLCIYFILFLFLLWRIKADMLLSLSRLLSKSVNAK